MKRLMRGVRRGEKGFTLIELLIVVAILGILAAVVVPNLAGFITAGNVAAANQEVAAVETAAMAYYAANDATWPGDSDVLDTGGYLSDTPAHAVAPTMYTFDAYGKVVLTDGQASAVDGNVNWVAADHMWE